MSQIYAEILKRTDDPTIPERAVQLLRSSHAEAQQAAVEILIEKPACTALDRLWELRRSVEGDREAFYFAVRLDKALAACVKLDPIWLERAIHRTDPAVEGFANLVYLLVHLADTPDGERVWRNVQEEVFAKTPSKDRRGIAYVIESFADSAALSRLAAWVGEQQEPYNLLVPAALRALESLDPEAALAALPKAGLDYSLISARSWWLPQLLAYDHDRTSRILYQKIAAHAKPWLAAAVYADRESLITVDILDLLLDATMPMIEEALGEPVGKHTLHRPLAFLAHVSRLDLLPRFEARRGLPFEEALTKYLVRQGPNDEGWYRWEVWDGIAVLQKIGGDGFTRLANHHLREAKTWLGIRDGFLLGTRKPDGETARLVVAIANDPGRSGPVGDATYHVQFQTSKALAALGEWREVVLSCLRLGLRIPRSLPSYLAGHTFSDEEVAPALEQLRSGTPSPGALLILGFSGRLDLASEIRSIFRSSASEPERALACLLALESLGDREATGLFVDNLASSSHSWVAERALLGKLRTPQTDEVLLERLRRVHEDGGPSAQLLVMNLLIDEATRERAARLLWEHVEKREIVFYAGDTIQYLAALDLPEVHDFLRETAFSEQEGSLHAGGRHGAIAGLARFDPGAAFDAARKLLRSDHEDRLLCPETLLRLDQRAAIDLFGGLLATTHDFLVLAAIGEALDRRNPAGPLGRWLSDADPRIRQGACFVGEAVRWSHPIEDLVRPLLHDPDWDVRSAARDTFEKLRFSEETLRLVSALGGEAEWTRRWNVVDAALHLGYPGILAGYSAGSWFGAMCIAQPYVLRGHALSKLEEKRKKLREELGKRERGAGAGWWRRGGRG